MAIKYAEKKLVEVRVIVRKGETKAMSKANNSYHEL